MVGNYEVTLSLHLVNADQSRVDLHYMRCEITPTNSRICEPTFPKNLFTWWSADYSYSTDWFSLEIDAKDIGVELRYKELPGTNALPSHIENLKKDLQQDLIKMLESRGIKVNSYDLDNIQLNFTLMACKSGYCEPR